jgi:hypothetical protein
MQKALHCRVLLWSVGRSGSFPSRLAYAVARHFANREWEQARMLHDQTSLKDAERLPRNLAALLAMDCDDVFTDLVVQRSYNLMYDRPTQEQSEDRLLDVVVEDHAIRSPLDAVAAWCSTLALKKVFETSSMRPGEIDLLQEQLDLALKIAPPGSAAEARALAGYALYGTAHRNAFYLRASEMLHSSHHPEPTSSDDLASRGPYFIDSSTPASARADIENCLNCAKALLVIDDEGDVEKACEFLALCTSDAQDTTLLTHVAMKHVLAQQPVLRAQRGGTKVEVGYESPCIVPMADGVWSQQSMLQQHKRRQSNASHDTGYESQDDEDIYDVRMESLYDSRPNEYIAR